MKIGIILSINDPETVWNTFRFGLNSLDNGHHVKTFLLGKGVECEDIKDDKFNIGKKLDQYFEKKGEIYACGTCLKIRKREGSEYCPMSTMDDMRKIVEESDKLLTFG